jgi:hypothetical protein
VGHGGLLGGEGACGEEKSCSQSADREGRHEMPMITVRDSFQR